jgi:perosamine synthetase
MNLDIARIEAAITPRTRAIIAVHLHGLMLDMDRLMAVAAKHRLKVIEDYCQSHGATFRGRKAGTFGHVSATSTNHNKCHCSGEGGFFLSNDDDLFELGRTLWYFGERRPAEGAQEYFIYGMGWMYRSTDLTAAFARAQLTRLDEYITRQKENAARLTAGLRSVPHLILPVTPEGHGHTFYNYTIRFDMEALGHAGDAAAFRDKLNKALNAEGVPVGVWQGWPVVNYDLAQYPVAQKHCDWHTGMTMPLRAPNGPDVADRMVEAFRKVMGNIEQVETL